MEAAICTRVPMQLLQKEEEARVASSCHRRERSGLFMVSMA